MTLGLWHCFLAHICFDSGEVKQYAGALSICDALLHALNSNYFFYFNYYLAARVRWMFKYFLSPSTW